jgi:hypothetical protein
LYPAPSLPADGAGVVSGRSLPMLKKATFVLAGVALRAALPFLWNTLIKTCDDLLWRAWQKRRIERFFGAVFFKYPFSC